MRELDCRGLACPAPVLKTRQVLGEENPGAMAVTVDNEAARENVSRFLTHQGFSVTTEPVDGGFRVLGAREGAPPAPAPSPAPRDAARPPQARKILVLVAADRLGRGDDALGAALLGNFLKTLPEMGPDLWRLVFVNSGVKCAVSGSAHLPALAACEKAGASILVCGTCLNHFHLLDQKKIGETTNMLDIVTGMQLADSVISV